MFELAAVIVVSAVAMSFFSDAMSRTVKVARAMSRREQSRVRVADERLSA